MTRCIYIIFVLLFFSNVYAMQIGEHKAYHAMTFQYSDIVQYCKPLKPEKCVFLSYGQNELKNSIPISINKRIPISYNFWKDFSSQINPKFFICFYKSNLWFEGKKALEMLVRPTALYNIFISHPSFKMHPSPANSIFIKDETLKYLQAAISEKSCLIVEMWWYFMAPCIFKAPRYLFLEKDGNIISSSENGIQESSMLLGTGLEKLHNSQLYTASATFINEILSAHKQETNPTMIDRINRTFRIIKFCDELSDSDIIVATILFDRLYKRIQEQKQNGQKLLIEINGLNINLLVVSCIILAKKILYDEPSENLGYADMFITSLANINLLERQILDTLNFDVNVSLECYKEYRQKILGDAS